MALGLALVGAPVAIAAGVDPEADAVLREMSKYLGGLSSFSVKGDVDNEIVDFAGQKLQLSSSATVVVERPGRMRMRRTGGVADLELIADGKSLTLYSRTHDRYAVFEAANVESAIRALHDEVGLDAPGADLFLPDSYSSLRNGVVSGSYLGWGYVDGVRCHHLAFREDQLDWQIWVQTGDTPLPMKYVITTKWVTGAPQYAARFHDWNTKPSIGAGRFRFDAPKGAKQVDSIPVNAAGQIVFEGGR